MNEYAESMNNYVPHLVKSVVVEEINSNSLLCG